jgi:hypothetical protein
MDGCSSVCMDGWIETLRMDMDTWMSGNGGGRLVCDVLWWMVDGGKGKGKREGKGMEVQCAVSSMVCMSGRCY